MPKRASPLSVKALNAVRPATSPIELVDGYVPGLRVRILPTGTRSWSLNVRDCKGVRRRFDVGINLGLSQARRKAEDLRRCIREGADPTTARRLARQHAKAAKDGVGTLAALIKVYFTNGPGALQRRAKESQRLIQVVFAKILDKTILEIQGPELQLIADAWQSSSTSSSAVRTLRPCLKWAEKRGLVRDGISKIEQPAKSRQRERVLTASELKAIWLHLTGTHGDVMKWLIWTGCRLNEAAGMTWGEISDHFWTIPAARAKNGRERTIPLSEQAFTLLRIVSRAFEESPVRADKLVFPSKRGGLLSNWDRETKRLQTLSHTSDWHRHDLRRAIATLLGDFGFAPHIISVVLGHAHIAAGATAIYARSRYQKEHNEALQRLADEIDLLVTANGNVIKFSVAR